MQYSTTLRPTGRAKRRAVNLLAPLLALALAACQSATPAPRQALAPPVAPVPYASYSAASTMAASGFLPFLGEAEPRGRSTLVLDAASGSVLYEQDADALRFPASLTKLMTLQLLFDAIDAGRLSMTSVLHVSENAAGQPPSKLGIEAGGTLRVRDAIAALSIKSCNDVAVVVAENLAGSEEAFAQMMNRRAAQLRMTRTRFTNASGLPDTAQVTTARDIARLARNIRVQHRRYASYFRATGLTYNGRELKATNKLLGKVAGVDGMKTGYIRLSGYNLVTTATRGGHDIIVVYFGGRTGASRDAEVTTLVERYL